MDTLTSASGILSLLDEPDNTVKANALIRLSKLVDDYWAEISDSIRNIESLYEDESFPESRLAALICSKVYFHLGGLDESLHFALGAGELFDVNGHSEYIKTIIAQCIDKYIDLRRKIYEKNDTSIKIEQSLEDVVERMFERCFNDKKYKQALGIALEARRLDKVRQSILSSENPPKMLSYCLDVAMNLIQSRDFRQKVLLELVSMYNELSSPDYFGVVECLMHLNDPASVAKILKKLITGDDNQILTAVQIAFDLDDRAPQLFKNKVKNLFKEEMKSVIPETKEEPKEETKEEKKDEKKTPIEERVERIEKILSGEVSIGLYVDFLFRLNRTDLGILNNIKGSFDRNSIYHNATIVANAFMHSGTTIDVFLRNNLEWLAKASNWAKFSATASLGIIHKGQIKDSLKILNPYLPKTEGGTSGNVRGGNSDGTSVYSEGGALYALGIIHSNSGEGVVDYLLNVVKNEGANEVVQHGACLGLGLAALATGNETYYEHLKEILYLDNAVSGEAAAIAMGLVMSGSGVKTSTYTDEMLAYAHETAHEKIIRGVAMGIALTQYGLEESADGLIDTLIADKDPILRYGGMYAIGLAYCGTANNSALRKLLHIAVSDVSDDVRRAATLNVGFLLTKTPKHCPRIVSLLAESYNPHVRYGATMAVGIACAGTGLKEAIELLEPLARDPVDFVRQGALIALAMICIQQTEAQEPKVTEIRKLLEKSWTGRQEILSKFGAIIAAGIIDAGGRNVTISLQKSGHNKMRSIIGIALFTQYWFWYPFLHFACLAFEPTSFIGLNKDLNMPAMSFKSNAKPSMFAYPPEMKPPEKKVAKLAPTAQLSTSKKQKLKEEKKKKLKEQEEGMEIDEEKKEEKKETTEEKKEEKKEEPNFEILQNPARVTPQQIGYLSFDVDDRYVPLKSQITYGITVLKNLKPEEKETLVELKSLTEEELPEPEAPEPFSIDLIK